MKTKSVPQYTGHFAANIIDKRSGIANDPNNLDDPQAIVRLIGQVITVSLATVAIVNQLPPLNLLP